MAAGEKSMGKIKLKTFSLFGKTNFTKTFKVLSLIFILATQPQCSNNNLFSVLQRDTDESRLYAAKMKMNDQDWQGAVDEFADMSADFLDKRTTKLEFAKAYAGLCGLDLFQLISDLAGADSLFLILETAMRGSTAANATACINAEAKIQEISLDAAQRNSEENLVMAFIELAKIGAIISSRANPDGDAVINWGNNDSCTVGNGTTNFVTSNEAKHVATGLANFIASLTSAGSSIAGSTLTDLTAVCDSIELNLGAQYNFCNAFVISGITADMEDAVRAALQEGSSGVGLATCTTGAFTIAECVCP